MEISKIKKALIEQKNIGLSGNLYHKTQIDFAYNTNHIEGSQLRLMKLLVSMILEQF